ncbi:hypothetical protein GUJ93_ZPchr0003g18601 [Zizania palustris]|uniref:Uncharacterized protein n=1 Tax=Zizania palustris TaxID=103762 RepID=A0A8J5VX06_ZIZPA|nr:hypothetical protein GUJ93_ZPchr0003g18601 [Zizania palustris]
MARALCLARRRWRGRGSCTALGAAGDVVQGKNERHCVFIGQEACMVGSTRGGCNKKGQVGSDIGGGVAEVGVILAVTMVARAWTMVVRGDGKRWPEAKQLECAKRRIAGALFVLVASGRGGSSAGGQGA